MDEKQLNGQQLAELYFERFKNWIASKSDDDFKQYIFRNNLNRTEIAKECGFCGSVMSKNKNVVTTLQSLEDDLRTRKILPMVAVSDTKSDGKGSGGKDKNEDRLRRLESENAMLRRELDEQKRFMQRYSIMEQFMSETMRMPR